MDVSSIVKLRFEVSGIESVFPIAELEDGREEPLEITFGEISRCTGKIPFVFLHKGGAVLKRTGSVFFRQREDGETVSVVVNDDLGTRFSDKEASQPFKMAIDGQYD